MDTNVLIYAATGRRSEAAKFGTARDLIAAGKLGLSSQVVAEFAANVRNARKMRHPLSFEETMGWVERLESFPYVAVDHAIVRAGVIMAERYRISYWDAAILAAAERLSAPVLYSENLNHGQTYGSVRVVNPFLST